MRYDQIIYYPPFERHSLLLQVSCGCSYNQCAFCNMYKTVDFELIPLKQIIADLREAAGSVHRAGVPHRRRAAVPFV